MSDCVGVYASDDYIAVYASGAAVSVYTINRSDDVSAYPSGDYDGVYPTVVVALAVSIPMVLLPVSARVIRIILSIPASCWYDVSHIEQIRYIDNFHLTI